MAHHSSIPTETNTSSDHDSHAESGHILPKSTYVTALIALLILTVITVGASRIDFGQMNFIVAMFIASIKAAIVCMFFMHLKYESPYFWGTVLVPVVLIFILIAFLYIDNPLRPFVGVKGSPTHTSTEALDSKAASAAH